MNIKKINFYRSQSAGPGREKLQSPPASSAEDPKSNPKNKQDETPSEAEQSETNNETSRPRTSSGAVIMSSSSSSGTSSGIGSMTSSEDDIASDTTCEPSPQNLSGNFPAKV